MSEAMASGRGTERPFHCHVHDDRNASASVNILKGVWHCFSCGASGRADDSRSTLDVAEVVRAMTEPEAIAVPRASSWLDLFDAHHPSPYWTQRYDRRTAAMFRCGTHPVSAEPTYPLRAGQPPHDVLGVVVRRDSGEPKYLYPKGASTSTTLFNIENATARIPRAVILCEGASDVMALYHARAVPDGVIALGCYGSGVHAPQRALLADFIGAGVTVCAFNNDDAGRRATDQAMSTLTGRVVAATITDVNDLGSATPDQRREVVSEALGRVKT